MALAEHLPGRPLAFAETGRRASIRDLDVIAPLYATVDESTASGDELVVACILAEKNQGELAGYDPGATSWNGVAVFPDITDLSGVFASLDMLDAWLFERYDPGDLVQINVEY